MEYWNNHRVMKFFLSCVLGMSGIVGIAGPSEAIAKDYFVAASNGNDANPGTKEAPFLRLEKGVSVLSPGDTLYVRGGTYQRNHYRWSSPSGISWTQPVSIKSYQNEKVIVKPLPSTDVPGHTVFYFLDNSQYIIMDGLTVVGTAVDGSNAGSYGYRMGTGSHHIRISNGEIKNTYNSAIQGSGAHYIEIINLKIHDSWLGTSGFGTGEKSYGFYLNGDYNLVQDCEIYNNHGYGIHLFSSTRKPSHNRIINNRIHDNKLGGIIVTGGTNNQVINNLFWANDRGIQVDWGATSTIVFHNTFYSNTKEEIILGPSSDKSFVKNNLLVGTSSYPVLFAVNGSGASQIENNLILGSSKDPNVLLKISDPSATSSGNLMGSSYVHGLKNPAGFDFHLTEPSSAIRAGLALKEVTTDLDGASRNSTAGYDIGAYQFGGAIALDPPHNLRISDVK